MNKKYVKILGNISLIITTILSLYFMLQIETAKKIYLQGDTHIAFILDVSRSMNVGDMNNASRLLAAKERIYSIIENNLGYNYALSIFAGESMRLVPFTSDSSLFSTLLSGADSRNIVKQGTNINGALLDALGSFGKEKTGSIILLTDGDEQDIPISVHVKKGLKDKEIDVYVLGVGSMQGGFIPTGDMFSPYKQYKGKTVIARLNSAGLKDLSDKLNGKYYNFEQRLEINSHNNNQKKRQSLEYIILGAFLFWILYIGSIGVRFYYDKK